MSTADWTEILLYLACLLLISPFLGRYCYAVYGGRTTFLSKPLGGLERWIYWLARIDPNEEMAWLTYTKAVLLFNGLGVLLLFSILLLQAWLPLNPQQFPSLPWPLALNTAVSYVTNTDWLPYVQEMTISNFSKMAGLTVQCFLSAGTGMTVFIALARAFVANRAQTIGNFWVDLVRSVLYILLPLSIVLALFLVTQGVVQTLHPYIEVTTLEGQQELIPVGPAASQVAIKQLGSNGGGFFRANSAHPFENPTRFSNFMQALSMLLISAAFPFTFAAISKSQKFGWSLFFVMLALWGVTLITGRLTEGHANPILGPRSFLEGKEQRFGMTRSILWFTVTTVTANGSVNAVQGSLSPLSVAISLFNMEHQGSVFGGVGVGMCSMLIFCMYTAFLANLLVGKSPEFISKQLGKRELRFIFLALLGPMGVTLLGAALTTVVPMARQGVSLEGPHVFSQLIYIFTSTTINNGSAFAYTSGNNNYFNIILSLTMALGRLSCIFPTLALAGGLAKKNILPPKNYRIRKDSLTFMLFLAGFIIFISLLPYLPALFLGPILEYFLMEQRIVL